MTTHYQRKRANAHSLPIDPGSLDVGYEEAEAMADELLGPPVDSHVSRAYTPVPTAVGDLVSIDGRGRYEVVGHEVDGEVVVLSSPSKPERWAVYSWRVKVVKRGGSQ